MTDWANGNIDQINELSARVSWSLDQLDDILDDAVDMTDDVDELLVQLELVRKDLSNAANAGNITPAFQRALTALKKANSALKSALPAIADAAGEVLDALVNSGDISEAMDDLVSALRDLNTVFGQLDDAISAMQDALKGLEDAGTYIQDALEQMAYLNNALGKVQTGLTDVLVSFRDLVSELAAKPDIKIEPIGSDITDKGDALEDAMDALLDSGDALNALISDSADTLIGDMKAINSQFRAITDLIRSEKADWDSDRSKSLEDQIKDRFQDVSDTCDLEKQHNGRVSASENMGAVIGNTNLGGIAGSIGIETDFNVDDDVTRVGDYSLDFHYQARALMAACVNAGTVTGRNDCAGGIVGQAHLGWINGCEGYGAVTTDGSYAGGIAGSAAGTIQSSWSKCALSGKDYVGGIAGYASTLTDCHTLVTVTGEAYTGAVAGDVDGDGTVSGNTFTHGTSGRAGRHQLRRTGGAGFL